MADKDFKGLTVERLKQLIHYDSETGVFTRIAASKNVALGPLQGAPLSDGHLRLKVDNRVYLSHRLAWFYVYGYWPKLIDHINGEPSDNRISNLREANHAVNMQNKRSPMKNNKCGFLGVSLNAGRYRAVISVNKKTWNLGRFDTPELAHEAYLAAKRTLHQGCTI
jgi:hypothetical protein